MKKRIFVVLGIVMCLSLTACGGDKKDNQAKGENKSTVEKDNTEDSKETMKEAEKTEEENKEEDAKEENTEEKVFNIGDSATLADWGITVSDVQIVESIAADYGSFSPEEEESKYVQVFVTVTNNGKKADRFLPSFGVGDDVRATVLYGDGYEFSSSILLGYNNDLHDSTINPLASKSGEIAFPVPNTVADATEELLLQFTSGNKKVEFKLR